MPEHQHSDSGATGPADTQAHLPGHEPLGLLDAPPERVGLLLAEARTSRGLGLAEAAGRLDADLDATQLMALESGALEVDDSVLAELSRSYGVEPDALVPPRSALVIDLNEGYLRAGPDIALLGDGVGRDAVLTRYLDMVWELRSVDPGTVVALRGADMAALSAQLDEAPEVLESKLRRMMAGSRGLARTGVLVGLGVALLAITGGVIAWQATGDDAPPTVPTADVRQVSTTDVTTTALPTTTVAPETLPPAPTAQIGDAATLEREAADDLASLPPAPTAEIGDAATLEREAADDLASLPPAPTAEIGDAVVQERNPDGSAGAQQTR